MKQISKPLIWLHGEIKTPPLTPAARIEAGLLLRRLQLGESLSLPHSRPMPVIGARCHELKIKDVFAEWRVFYRTDSDAVVILDVVHKQTRATPRPVIDLCISRLKRYDDETK